MNEIADNARFGMIKTIIDAHTLGIRAASALLEECGYQVFIANSAVERAMLSLEEKEARCILIDWINDNHITNIGFSYRLDPGDAVKYLSILTDILLETGLYGSKESLIQTIHFAGLAPACDSIDELFDGKVVTFRGGEDAETTLLMMGVPKGKIPASISEGCSYDKKLRQFGKRIIQEREYLEQKPLTKKRYPNLGTEQDSLTERLDANFVEGFNPLTRAHSGPYRSDWPREKCVEEYIKWCKDLSDSGYLDILSIGASQLSQSNFGENWEGIANGGGVPINSEEEYSSIWKAASPMLVRTYSGTQNVKKMAEIYDRTINNAWHALSLWWFDELDGRGPNKLYDNLQEHIDTIKYCAENNRVFEANVPHHFAFRGCDDVTYIVTSFLSAKLAKRLGIKTFVLQNMLNTPRSTWGIQDIAKSRALLKLVAELEDDNYRVLLQTRAGLDYFKPDLTIAKEQLAAVTALMDDIEPENQYSPDIIHVVSYSEAVKLATPDIINESIQITRQALAEYRAMKKNGNNLVAEFENDIERLSGELESDARKIVDALEESIEDLYSPEGFYIAFVAGWFPVPELWSMSEDYQYAKAWNTRMKKGGSVLCKAETNEKMNVLERISICKAHYSWAKERLDIYRK